MSVEANSSQNGQEFNAQDAMRQEIDAQAALTARELVAGVPIQEGVEHGPRLGEDTETSKLVGDSWAATKAAAEGQISRDAHNQLRDENAKAYEAVRSGQSRAA